MYSSRFSFPEPDVAERVIRDSYKLNLELFCFSGDDGPPTIEGSYEIKGAISLQPGDDATFLAGLIAAFRAAQVAKGGDHECNS